jgi:hypothetical protein
LAELITTGAVVGKTITITDASSLRNDQTATGGDSTPLADAGEGDGLVATFANGIDALPVINSGVGIASVTKNGVGDYSITLSDAYSSLKSFKGLILQSSAVDLRFQIHSETVSSTKIIRFLTLTGATPTDMPAASSCLVKLELKNSQGF